MGPVQIELVGVLDPVRMDFRQLGRVFLRGFIAGVGSRIGQITVNVVWENLQRWQEEVSKEK